MKPPRWMRATRLLLKTAGWTVGLIGFGALGVLLHITSPPGRALTASVVTEFLSDFFQGSVEVHGIHSLNLQGLDAQEVHVYDTYGNRVLVLHQLRARTSLQDLAHKLLWGGPKISLVIRHVRVERAEAQIVPDTKTGIPTIGDAFTPEPTPEGPPSERYVRVWLPEIEIGRIFGRGEVSKGAPTLEVDLSNVKGSVLVTPKGTAIDVTGFGMRARGVAGADARGLSSFHLRYPGPIWGFFDGYFADVQTSAFVNWLDGRLKVRVDLPKARAEDVRALWLDYPLQTDAALHAEAEGPISALQTSFELKVLDSRVTGEGKLDLADDVGAELKVTGKSVDLRALWPELPKTAIDLETSLAIWAGPRQTNVEFNGYAEPGVFGEWQLPAIDVVGTYDEVGLVSRATLHEPGMAAKVSFDRSPTGVINLELDARRFSLDHPRLRPYFRARGVAEATVKARIEGRQLKGSFEAGVQGFRYEDIQLARARLDGTMHGSIDNLQDLSITTHLKGQGFSRDNLRFDNVAADARGPVSRPQLQAKLTDAGGQQLVAKGTLRTVGGVGVEQLSVELANQGAELALNAAHIESKAGHTTIKDLHLVQDGAELRGDIELMPDGVKLRAKGRSLDLDKLSRALGVAPGSIRGRVTVDADIVSTKTTQEGSVDATFEQLQVGAVRGVSGSTSVQLDNGELVAQGEVEVDGFGRLGASADLHLDGRVDDLEVWKRVTGSSRIEFYAMDLAYFNRYLGDTVVDDIQGIGHARIRLEREAPDSIPNVMFDASTQGLRIALARADEAEKPEIIRGIDLQLGGAIEGERGQVSGSVRALDGSGPLVSASGTARADLGALWEGVATPEEVAARTEFETVFVVPRRELQSLPEQLRPPSMDGSVAGRLAISGTARAPVLSGQVDVQRLRGAATHLSSPIGVQARFSYLGESGVFGGSVEASHRSDRILWGNFKGQAGLDQLAAGQVDGPRWTGAGTFSVESLPLRLLQPLSRARIGGRLSGVLAVARQSETPEVNAQFQLTDGEVDDIPLGTGELSARVARDTVSGKLRFASRRGSLRVALNTKIDWNDPNSLGAEPIALDFESDNYDAVLILPFVESLFLDLSGPLDAKLHAEVKKRVDESAQAPDAAQWDAVFRGHAKLKGGTLRPVALGMQLRDTDLDIVAKREDEYNVLEITKMTAAVRADKPNLNAVGKVYFKGIALSHGWFSAGLNQVPFVVNGVRLADATGQVGASMRSDPDRMSARVEMPQMRVALPRSAGRALIDLAPNPNITVIQEQYEDEEVAERGLPWVIQIDLGNEVRVTSATLNLLLSGSPKIVLGDKMEVDGKIVLLPGGRANVASKQFVVETGFVQFDSDDFTNPHLSIRAVWRAPNGIRVTANLSGTAHEPELMLESDPPLAGGEAEIYALLFGGGEGSTEGSAADPALGAGATALSEVLGNTALKGVELRAGVERQQSNTQSVQLASNEWRSYAAAVPLSDDVWFEGSYKTEERATASEARAGFAGTIDWRFSQNWALRTELGELGTGLDVLWHYRY